MLWQIELCNTMASQCFGSVLRDLARTSGPEDNEYFFDELDMFLCVWAIVRGRPEKVVNKIHDWKNRSKRLLSFVRLPSFPRFRGLQSAE